MNERLKLACRKRRVSQRELADITGLKPSAISHFCSGRRKPNFNNLCRLADALSINIDFLLSRSDEMIFAGNLLNVENIKKLSSVDQEFLASMAEQLALKNNELV